MATVFSNQVDDVGGVSWIEDGEAFWEPERLGIHAQSPMGDSVKRATRYSTRRLTQRGVSVLRCQHHAGSVQHLACGPSGECQQEEAFRGRSVGEQPRDASRQSGCLAGSGTSQNPERAPLVCDGSQLRLVELVQPVEHMFDSTPFRSRAPRGQCGMI